MTNPPLSRAANLALIRIALLGGVLLFGGVSYYLHHAGSAPPAPGAEQARMLRWIGYAVWGGAIAAIFAVRALFARATDAGRRANLTIIGWALGESPALYGGVIYFLSGDWQLYIAGLVAMLTTFAIFPAPRR